MRVTANHLLGIHWEFQGHVPGGEGKHQASLAGQSERRTRGTAKYVMIEIVRLYGGRTHSVDCDITGASP